MNQNCTKILIRFTKVFTVSLQVLSHCFYEFLHVFYFYFKGYKTLYFYICIFYQDMSLYLNKICYIFLFYFLFQKVQTLNNALQQKNIAHFLLEKTLKKCIYKHENNNTITNSQSARKHTYSCIDFTIQMYCILLGFL